MTGRDYKDSLRSLFVETLLSPKNILGLDILLISALSSIKSNLLKTFSINVYKSKKWASIVFLILFKSFASKAFFIWLIYY